MGTKINPNPQSYEKQLEHKRLEAGWVGKFFGTGDSARTNIAGIVSLILLISIITAWLIDKPSSKTYMDYMVPVLTLLLGYLFGKNT